LALQVGDRKRTEGHSLLSAAIEHMRVLKNDSSEDEGGKRTEALKDLEGGLVWWFLYVSSFPIEN
jgi:hypothetical protein